MSEKVLYEWTDALGDEWRLIDGPRPMGMGFQRRSAESGWVWAAIMPSAVPDLAKALLGLVREVHRLTALRKADLELHEDNAARITELEAENAKLRKCVEAADSEIEAWREWGARIGGDERVCGWVHQEDYGLYCLLADPPVSDIPYDAARAEVDNG